MGCRRRLKWVTLNVFYNNLKTIGFRPLVSTEVVYKYVVSDHFKHTISSVSVADL